jgi:hypothetical protein
MALRAARTASGIHHRGPEALDSRYPAAMQGKPEYE